MKYETYKKLNKQQKEEWNFRFKDIYFPTVSIIYLFGIYMFLVAYLALSLVILKEYVYVNITVIRLIQHTTKITGLIFLVWMFDYVGQLLFYFYKINKSKKWLKEQLK